MLHEPSELTNINSQSLHNHKQPHLNLMKVYTIILTIFKGKDTLVITLFKGKDTLVITIC